MGLNAKKIKDTRFPFPHAQAIAVLILILSVLTPLVITSLMQEALLAMAATFVPMLGLCILNYAAEELEMPFGDDANDLPMSHFQEEMNSSLLMLIHGCSDHVPSLKATAPRNFESLQASLTDTRNSLNDVLNGKKGRKSLFVAAMAPSQSMETIEDDQDSYHSQWTDLPPSVGGSVGQPDVEATPGGVQTVGGPSEVSKPGPPDDLNEAASSKAEKVQADNPPIKRAQQDEEAQRRVRVQQEEKASGSSNHSAGKASVRSVITGNASNGSQLMTTGDRVNALLQDISPRLGWQSASTASPMSPHQSRWKRQQQQWSPGQEVRPSPPRSQVKVQDMLASPNQRSIPSPPSPPEVGFLTCEV